MKKRGKRKTSPRKKAARKSTREEHGLGGLIGTGIGAIAGSIIPGAGTAIGASLGGALGGGIDSIIAGNKQKNKIKDRNAEIEAMNKSFGSGSLGQFANGGPLGFIGQNAFSFTGPSHENGGIPISDGAEVEGGETMDFIEFKNGGMMDTRKGSPYIFSKRLTVPETNTTFADTHKKLVKDNASEDDIKELAMMQEKITGRDQMKNGGQMKYQTGGLFDPDPLKPKPYDFTGGYQNTPSTFMTDEEKTNLLGSIGYNPDGTNKNTPKKNAPWNMLDGIDLSTGVSKPATPKSASTPSTKTPSKKTFAPGIARAGISPVNVSPELPSTELTSVDMEGVPSTQTANGIPNDQPAGMSAGLNTALQFIPEIMNFATGAFGKNDTPAPTRVNNRAVDMMETDVNVNPQLLKNAQSYRSIISDPNATANQKLAAQAAKMQADSAVLANKINQENQMKSNQARVQANIDSQNARFGNQARSEGMMGDAMFGPTGNIARGALGSASQKILQQQAQGNREKQDKIAAMSIISQLDPALQEKFINQLGLLQ